MGKTLLRLIAFDLWPSIRPFGESEEFTPVPHIQPLSFLETLFCEQPHIAKAALYNNSS
jgi:hypothetical protein